MVLLIDTNIVLDYLLKRDPFYDDAKQVMQLCCKENVSGSCVLYDIVKTAEKCFTAPVQNLPRSF